jgi:hypothetical protein
MAKSTHALPGSDKGPPDPENLTAFRDWLEQQPREWSVTLAARSALRVLPFVNAADSSVIALHVFRASAIARFAAKYPNRAIEIPYLGNAVYAANAAAVHADTSGSSAAAASDAAYTVYAGSATASYAANSLVSAANALISSTDARASVAPTVYFAAKLDAQRLHDKVLTAEQLARDQLWPIPAPAAFSDAWQRLRVELITLGSHWSIWIDWYEGVAIHEPHRGIAEVEDAAFTDVSGVLPWNDGAEAVNTEIARRLRALKADPLPIDGLPSPISISQRPDGRIVADAGTLGLPALPGLLTPEDHEHALAACRGRAEQLRAIAILPVFQGRSEYAEALAAYLEWLPLLPSTGNILLADGEARVLNKLFAADEGILPTGFAGRLSVLLEDHIGLRSYYPELERHYHAVRTGRLAVPLSRDAVEAIRNAIHAHTPDVFHESVAPAMDEAAKPVPDAKPPLAGDAPPFDPSQPKPPKDPIPEVDPVKSRSLAFASAANRIWEILRKGKDLPQTIDGWQKTYDQFKPHIGAIIEWLKHFLPGGGDGMPPMPPTLSV